MPGPGQYEIRSQFHHGGPGTETEEEEEEMSEYPRAPFGSTQPVGVMVVHCIHLAASVHMCVGSHCPLIVFLLCVFEDV